MSLTRKKDIDPVVIKPVSKSLSKDVKKHAKKEVKPGYSDKGDQSKKKGSTKKK